MLNTVEDKGPMVLEDGICSKCGMEWWAFHQFWESIPCGNCGHRNASGVARYSVIEDE